MPVYSNDLMGPEDFEGPILSISPSNNRPPAKLYDLFDTVVGKLLRRYDQQKMADLVRIGILDIFLGQLPGTKKDYVTVTFKSDANPESVEDLPTEINGMPVYTSFSDMDLECDSGTPDYMQSRH